MNKEKLLISLKELNKKIKRSELFPAYSLEAQELIVNNPYAFLIAICLDRGTRVEVIWSIPFAMKQVLGELNPYEIYKMDEDQIIDIFKDLPYKPRYVNDAPKTITQLTKMIVEDYEGKPSMIWEGKSAKVVKDILMSIYGVGPGIASMGLLLIEKAFGPQFSKEDHRIMDIKPDIHTKRVLFRLGLARSEDEAEAIFASRTINPEYPGEVDGPLWIIGRQWCHATNPDCKNCYVSDNCDKVSV